jgi:hypothetical protein
MNNNNNNNNNNIWYSNVGFMISHQHFVLICYNSASLNLNILVYSRSWADGKVVSPTLRPPLIPPSSSRYPRALISVTGSVEPKAIVMNSIAQEWIWSIGRMIHSRGKSSYWREICPISTFTIKNLIWAAPGFNPNFRSEKTVSNA